MPIFFDDSDRVDFGHLLGVGHQRFGVQVHAYCLMTNHFHLLLHCPDGGLSGTRHVNDRLGRDGPLFGGRFRSFVVDSDAYILCATRYIHRNPLDIAEVRDIEAYRWSSHRTYLGHRCRPDWLRTDHVLAPFGDDTARYDSFVRDDDEGSMPGSVGPLGSAAVASLVDVLIEEHIGPEPVERPGLRKAVTMLAHASLVADGHTDPFDGRVPAGDAAYRSALSRARRRAEADTRIAVVADRVRRLAA